MLEILTKILKILFMIILISLILSLPTWLLWNWLMPDIFGLPKINLLQTIGLLLLSNLFFNSSHGDKNE